MSGGAPSAIGGGPAGEVGAGRGASRSAGLAMVILAAVFWGTLSVLTKLAYRLGAEPLPTLGARYALAALIVWLVLGALDPSSLAVGRRNLARIVVIGLSGYGVASTAFFIALSRIDASLAALILYTYPTMVAVASVRMFGEPLSPRMLAALALTFGGVALAVGVPSAPVDALGVAICAVAPVGYSVFSLLSFKWRLSFRPEAIVAWGLPVAAVPIIVLGGAGRAVADVISWPASVWILILAMALFPTVGAIGLYVRGMARLGAPGAAVAATIEPVVTLLLALAVLRERLGPVQWVGAALVIGGVAVSAPTPASRAGHAA